MIEYKGYYIKTHTSMPGLFVIVTTGQGGKIPSVLSSAYTKVDYAKLAIDGYLNSKKEKVDAQTKSEGRVK